jgi:hypothetical protein
MRNGRELSIEEGIEIQQGQLLKYKYKVTPEVYNLLSEECSRQNELPMKDGYSVFRGNSIDTFFSNIKEGDLK